jgi:hypothetical protein
MKVLDLQCQHQHLFEGWFGSEDDFQSQLQRGLIECPMCGDKSIHKMLSAPRLNLRRQHHREAPEAVEVDQPPQLEGSTAAVPAAQPEVSAANSEAAQNLQAAWLKMSRHLMSHTEDVGENFAAEARRMHEGEAVERGIRGQATPEEARELLEEGIPVLPLVLPESAKKTLQ